PSVSEQARSAGCRRGARAGCTNCGAQHAGPACHVSVHASGHADVDVIANRGGRVAIARTRGGTAVVAVDGGRVAIARTCAGSTGVALDGGGVVVTEGREGLAIVAGHGGGVAETKCAGAGPAAVTVDSGGVVVTEVSGGLAAVAVDGGGVVVAKANTGNATGEGLAVVAGGGGGVVVPEHGAGQAGVAVDGGGVVVTVPRSGGAVVTLDRCLIARAAVRSRRAAGAGGGGGAPVAVGGICRTTGAAGNRPRMLADGRGCFRGGTVLPHHPVNGDAHVLSRWTLCRIRIGRLGRGRPRRRG